MIPFHIALYEPEIPPNTGNIGRLCTASDCRLHLIGKLGFSLEDKYLRRAGLDYWPSLDLHQHASMADFETLYPSERFWCLTKTAARRYTEVAYQAGDVLVFGPESRGLPAEILNRYEDRLLSIPMPSGKVRSLNLSVAVGIVVYEGLRQLNSW